MSQTSTEQLRDYLAHLSPKAQALLMREFERAIETGPDATVATFVLGELRKIVRAVDGDETSRTNDPARVLFHSLEPFLVEGNGNVRPGQIRRGSLLPVWHWLSNAGAPQDARAFAAHLAASGADRSLTERDRLVRNFQIAAADAIAGLTAHPGGPRELSRIGPRDVIEDMIAIEAVLRARDALEALDGRLSGTYRVFADSQIASVGALLDDATLQSPQVLPFALRAVMARLSAPWQIIRLAIAMAGSDDEVRVAAKPYGIAVTIAIHDLARIAGDLRSEIKRGQFSHVSHHLRAVHDGVRGLRTELDLRTDSTWGRQLAAIRVDISNALQLEIDSVPGRVRRLLRQRAEKDISPITRLDQTEIDETADLIEFVAVCRTYASELAINEVTLRTFSDLQHYVEQSTQVLVESLRGGDVKARAFRQAQVKVAIRFCDILFGHDYATLMNRAAESAMAGERRPSRTA